MLKTKYIYKAVQIVRPSNVTITKLLGPISLNHPFIGTLEGENIRIRYQATSSSQIFGEQTDLISFGKNLYGFKANQYVIKLKTEIILPMTEVKVIQTGDFFQSNIDYVKAYEILHKGKSFETLDLASIQPFEEGEDINE